MKINNFLCISLSMILLSLILYGCSVERVLYNGFITEIKLGEEETILILDVSEWNYKEKVIEVIVDNSTTYDETSINLLKEGSLITVEGVMDNKKLKAEIIGITDSQK